MHKYSSRKLPISFENFFVPFAPQNRTNSFILNEAKSKFSEQFPNFFLPRIWNENSLFIKLTESHKVNEKEITNELLKTHLSHVKCHDIECMDCFPIN